MLLGLIMKLLYIQDILEFGGINRISSVKQNYLINKNYEIINLCMADKKNNISDYKYDDKIKFKSLYTSDFDRFLSIPIIGRLIRFIYYRFNFLKILLQINPDIIITTRDYIEPLTIILLTFWKKRILEFHGSLTLSEIENVSLNRRLRYLIKYRFYNLVTLTYEDKKIRESNFGGKYYVIPNPNYFIPDKLSNLKEKNVVSIGRYNFQKGYDLLIPKWKKVSELYPSWKLNIYGKGEQRDFLHQLICDNKLENQVILCGPTNDLNTVFHKSSIFVMSSRFEGFPLVIPESMSYGVPCVSLKCPAGPSEIISDGEDGFLAENSDFDDLINKVILLIKDESVRIKMGKKASENIKRYSIENIMTMWEELFYKIRNGK